MKWSHLKNQIETKFADSIAGRVEVWNTRYRKSHDQEGEAWITFDKERICSMGAYTFYKEAWLETLKLRKGELKIDWFDSEIYSQRHEAEKIVKEKGVLAPWDFNSALYDYLNLSIDAAIVSDNPVIRSLAVLDKRFGKRRLNEYDDSKEHPLVRMLYHLRCKAEGLNKNSEQDTTNHRSPSVQGAGGR